MSFFLCFALEVHASSWRYEWDAQTTSVEVPLGDNLQNYLTVPKAMLYKDNMAILDANIQYISTGDWLYLLTDVDTSKVGSYQVWYKAYEDKYQPGQCQGYKTLVTFHVVDKEKPRFKEIPKVITYYIGTSRPNYESQIIAEDNSGNCTLTIDDTSVRYDYPGMYYVYVRASDGFHITEERIEIIVEDPVGPIITFLGDNQKITFIKDEVVDLQKYFKAVDKIDGDVTGSITYDHFTTEEERRFTLEVSFFDSNNNKSSMLIEIEIVDRFEPVIELTQPLLILEYDKPYEEAIRSNIKTAYLGKEDITMDIEIHTNLLKNKVGSYFISYTYNKNGKYKEVKCEIKMLSSVPPILLIENAKVEMNTKIHVLDYLTVRDPSDEEIVSKISYDDSMVDYSKEGTYRIPISVTNSSGLSTTDVLQVLIYSSESNPATEFGLLEFGVIFVILGLLSVGLYIFIRKKRNCNKEENTL